MPSECDRCGSELAATDGAVLTMTAMSSGGVGEVDAFLCEDCAELVRDVLEGESE